MSNDPFVGRIIDGRYEIQARIGEGGMGVVYRARQISIDRVIAIKMLNAQMAQDPTWVQRFYNEAKACSRLQHPNTIRMFDFGQTQDSRLFMTMEFLDGVSLRDAIGQGPFAPQRVIKILIQCCASLAEAHSIGIIHRDIKPDNVFLLNMAGSPDFVKLLDFSVAKLMEGDRMKTQAGVVFGTPQYMSPEQGRGLPLDARSDLYALGILGFEMLSGNVPFNDENPMTVIQMHMSGNVPPLPQTVPYSVQQIVRRAMEKDPSRRYQSAGEMMQHAQQVFSELNQGNVAMGAGGVPRTVIAALPNMGGHPGQQQQPQQGYPGQQQMPQQGMPQGGLQQQQPQGGYQATGAAAKTMIAGMSPFAAATVPQGSPYQQPQPPPGGPAGAQGKTIVAGMAPQFVNGQFVNAQGQPMAPPGMQPGAPQGYPPPNANPQFPQNNFPQPGQHPPGGPPGGGGPAKTVMLQDSAGLISAARAGQQIQALPGQQNVGPQNNPGVAVQGPSTGAIQQGASTLFWIISLLVGIAIGAVAYIIVLKMG